MSAALKVPFSEHIRELRARVIWSLIFIGIGAGIGYYFYDQLLYILQLPYGKELYYTTPAGAFSFLIKVCLTFGFITGLPVLTYQLLAFIAPVAQMRSKRTVFGYLIASVCLAVTGIGFAYFISLPAALHFLVNFGSPESIQALITANEYFNFILAYLAGFAVLFQIPLLIIGANRITPIKPLKLLKNTKYVLLLSFVIAAILTPTPDPFNQAIMAGPMVILYLASIALVAILNRKKKPVIPSTKTEEPLYPSLQPVNQPLASNQKNFVPAYSMSSPPNQVSSRATSGRLMHDIVAPGSHQVRPLSSPLLKQASRLSPSPPPTQINQTTVPTTIKF